MKYSILIFSLFLVFVACKSDDDEDVIAVCDNSTSLFQTLYTDLVEGTYIDAVTMDLTTHEYTFVLTADRKLCEIGYQSQHQVPSTPYTIEIIDNSISSTIYSEDHMFSSTSTSYITPTETINLLSGVSYTIKRIQTNYTLLRDIVGRMAINPNMSFPYQNGILKITGSNFYGTGGPAENFAIPYIDLILN